MLTLKENLKVGWYEREFKKTLSKDEKKIFKNLSTEDKGRAVLKYVDGKKVDFEKFKVKEETPLVVPMEETSIENVEPDTYDLESIISRIKIEDYEVKYQDLSPIEIKIADKYRVIRGWQAETDYQLEMLQEKHPTTKLAYDYKDVEPNYHNQKFFDLINKLYEGVDYENLTLLEQMEIKVDEVQFAQYILKSQPIKKVKSKK